jgi:hypothetical protein
MTTLSHRTRLARRVAARWSLEQALGDWQPPIPKEAREFLQGIKVAYIPDTDSLRALDDARSSVQVMLPKILTTLTKHQGDRYYMNASESHGKIFYFFSPRQPIDAFSLTLYIKGDEAVCVFGYTPYKLNGMLDFANMKSERTLSRPEMAGLGVMRIMRELLATI